MWYVEKLIEFFVYLRVKYKLEWTSSDYDNKQYCYMYFLSTWEAFIFFIIARVFV